MYETRQTGPDTIEGISTGPLQPEPVGGAQIYRIYRIYQIYRIYPRPVAAG